MEKKFNKKYILIPIFLVVLIATVFVLGKSLAFFNYEKHGETVNVVTFKGLDIDILNSSNNSLSLVNAYPMYDSDGLAQTPLEFNITNLSSNVIDYTLKIETDTEKLSECVIQGTNTPCTGLSTNYIKYAYKFGNGEYSEPANLGSNSNIVLDNTILGGNTTKVSLVIWIDSTATNEIEGQVFYGKLVLEATKSKTLAGSVISYQPVIKENPTLTSSTDENNESGLYKMSVTNGFGGANGYTYYFRGDVSNNYVEFAGILWRIVRINEDGTIRLIVDDAVNNDTRYQFSSDYSDYNNVYYTNSDIKSAIDTWYQQTIVNGGYDSYVASGNYFCEQARVKWDDTYTFTNVLMANRDDYTPTLQCSTDANNKGLYNSKVALLTYDEVVLAGGYPGEYNTSYYLYKGAVADNSYYWWLMSPMGMAGSIYGSEWRIDANGVLEDNDVEKDYYLRPVINLKSDLEISGTGTKTDPYVVGYKKLSVNSYDTLNALGKVHGATKQNGYVSFDGVDDYIDLGLANYDFGNTFSMAIKVKFNQLNKYQDFFNNFQSAGMGIDIMTNNHVRAEVNIDSVGWVGVSSINEVNSDNIYVIVLLYDGNSIKLYINGVYQGETLTTNNFKISTMPIYLGANPDENGSISSTANINVYKVAVFDRALTAKEIQNGFTNDIKIYNPTDLLVYEDFTINQ